MDIFSNPWFIAIVAGLIVGLLLYFVFGKGKAKPKHEPTKPAMVDQPDTQLSPSTLVTSPNVTPTPKEIIKYLKGLPPFQVDQAAKNYQGIKVKWTVVLRDSFTVSGKQYITTSPSNTVDPTIVCPIDIDKYPQLKIMEKGQEFTLEGTIASVDKFKINLDNCLLYFH